MLEEIENRCCGTCEWYDGTLGDGWQFCDELEIHTKDEDWCNRYRRREDD